MRVEPHDPKLTALLLGELSERERAALEAEVANQPELADSFQGLQETAATLRQELAAESCPHLTAAQREHVLREIASAGSTGGVSSPGTWSALLAAVGWGSRGAWLVLGTTVMLLAFGLAAWQLRRSADHSTPDVGDTPVGLPVEAEPACRREATSLVGPAAGQPPLITLRVGESLPLRVLGRVPEGREACLAADRLTWSTEPLVGFVEFDARRLMLTGVKATPQPVLLTVRLGELTAQARILVIEGVQERR